MNEIGNFNLKVGVIANGFEKYMPFTIDKNFFFVESKQFRYSSLVELVKVLSDDNFKHLTQEFGSDSLKLLKEKLILLMNKWTILGDFVKKKLPDKKIYRSLKD